MMRFDAIGSVLIVLCWLAIGSQAFSQNTDIRLTPDEPQVAILPADITIQSAAWIGEGALAVWGTEERDENGNIRNALRYQLWKRSGAGDVGRLAGAVDPYGAVHVLAAGERFMVVWNDRRTDAPGIYAQRFLATGEPVGEGVRISAGAFAGRAPMLLGDPEGGMIFLWYDARSQPNEVYSMRLDSSGFELSSERKLEMKEIGMPWVSATLPGAVILPYENGGYFVDHNGRIDARRIPAGRFSSAFSVAADTSLITISGNRLLRFASIFDASPSQEISIPALDSAKEPGTLLYRDTEGTTKLYFHTIHGGPLSKTTELDVSFVTVGNNGEISAPSNIFHRSWENTRDFSWIRSYTYIGSRVTMGCDNQWRADVIFTFYQAHRDDGHSRNDTISFALDRDGNYAEIASGIAWGCSPGPASIVWRDTSRVTSAIRLDTGSDTVLLVADVVLKKQDIIQRSPGLSVVGGTLLLSWRQMSEGAVVEVLNEWNPVPGGSVSQLGSLNGVGKAYCTQNGDILSTSTGVRYIRLPVPEKILVILDAQTRTQVRRGPTQGSIYTTTLFCSSFRLSVAGSTGWNSIAWGSSGSDDPFGSPPAVYPWQEVRGGGYDPDRNLMFLKLMNFLNMSPAATEIHVAAGGNTRRLGDFPATDTRTLLAGNRMDEYLMLGERGGARYRDTTLVTAFSFRNASYGAIVQRTLGGRFIRAMKMNPRTWRLELYDLDGVLLGSNELPISAADTALSIIQSRDDSSFVLTYIADDGVHAIVLNSSLGGVASDLRVSSTATAVGRPAAALVRSMLHVAWEDHREGGADIYGTVQRVEGIASAPAERGALPELAKITPNPAGEYVTFDLPGGAGEVQIEIITIIGERVRMERYEAAGSSGHRIDLHDIPAGCYLLHYRNGAVSRTLPLNIMR